MTVVQLNQLYILHDDCVSLYFFFLSNLTIGYELWGIGYNFRHYWCILFVIWFRPILNLFKSSFFFVDGVLVAHFGQNKYIYKYSKLFRRRRRRSDCCC